MNQRGFAFAFKRSTYTILWTLPENLEELKRLLEEVPQIVPEERCSRCRICCRFPDTQNVQTPFWSEAESRLAQKAGASPEWFLPVAGTPSRSIRLGRCGEGYQCPAFDAATSRCTIHSVKPMDCRLYPFVLAVRPGGSEAVLAMDMKCPYLQEHPGDPAVAAYARRLAEYLSSPQAVSYLRSNPKIIGSYWPEFVAVAELPEAGAVVQEQTLPAAPPPPLRPLGPEERPMLERALGRAAHAASGYSVPALYGWRDIFRLYWAEWEGLFCLFAEQSGGWFMPLPPLGEKFQPAAARKAWQLLVELNQGSGVSRVEGIETREVDAWRAEGFRIRFSQEEYLYRRADLAALRGDRYRSQRGTINRFQRESPLPCRVRPLREGDLTACLQLYTQWGIEKQKRCEEEYPRSLIRQGLFFHRRILMEQREWGLTGQVAEIGDRVAAYTVGVPLSPKVFCILVEIADPSLPGLGAFLFREFCRGMSYPLVNAMGDEGLEGLRRAKRSYRPIGFARGYAADLPRA